MRVPGLKSASSPVPSAGGSAVKAAALKEMEAQFGAMLLDAALPKGKSVFGKGLSGSIAREGLVKRLAHSLSEAGALGLRKETGNTVSNAAAPAVDAPQPARGRP